MVYITSNIETFTKTSFHLTDETVSCATDQKKTSIKHTGAPRLINFWNKTSWYFIWSEALASIDERASIDKITNSGFHQKETRTTFCLFIKLVHMVYSYSYL